MKLSTNHRQLFMKMTDQNYIVMPQIIIFPTNNLCKKNASPRAEVYRSAIEAVVGENFFLKTVHVGYKKKFVFFSGFQKYKLALVTKCT
jgi:hypothetical protein